MKAFVTGATGFVGSHVARQLASQGADLRLLVRAGSSRRNVDTLRADCVVGDLLHPETFALALGGCDAVFHVAADYRLWTRNKEDVQSMYRANVDATRALLKSAIKAGVRRFVYCSSVATMGFTADGRVVDESFPVSIEGMIGHYKRSKFLGEQEALRAAAARTAMDVVIVNPTTPVGEQDVKPTPTGRIIVDFLKGKFPAYVDTGLNLVDVTEVARGHIAALEKGRSGERYILGGENLTLKQILDKLAALSGLPSPRIRLPYAVALGFGALDTLFEGMLLRREPRASLESVRMGRKKMFASDAKAQRELGWKTIPVDGALQRAVTWFRMNGYV
ncbi:MAG TPA: hopanoid-associated sugar epimerase [Terriglobales bacterium]|nr:hopanoid-associated sugar epimerase [Terriglobales bacterium]